MDDLAKLAYIAKAKFSYTLLNAFFIRKLPSNLMDPQQKDASYAPAFMRKSEVFKRNTDRSKRFLFV